MNEEPEQRCTVADRTAPCDWPPCFTGNACHGGDLWPADTTLPTATPPPGTFYQFNDAGGVDQFRASFLADNVIADLQLRTPPPDFSTFLRGGGADTRLDCPHRTNQASEKGETVNENAAPDGHLDYVCLVEHQDGGVSCMFCAGGLSACSRCHAFEGAWPDECPGEWMTPEQVDAVYGGRLNFRAGAWHEGECCAVMRPIHDREAWLAEVAAAGNLLDGES